MIGLRFGTLTVARENGFVKNGSRPAKAWLCKCDCGKTRTVSGAELRRGRIQSCGVNPGLTKTPEYISYHAMRARCLYPRNKEFSNYGGRGIKISERWLNGEGCKNGFYCFLEDMGKKPTDSHTLDRIDTNGHYETTNCRWATPIEQARNKRNTRTVTIDGRTIPLAQAAEEADIPYDRVLDRLDRYHMPVDRALSRQFFRYPRQR